MSKFKSALAIFFSFSLVSFWSFTILAKEDPQRFFLNTQNGFLKAILGVRQNFDHGFTAELTSGQLKILQFLGSKIGFTIEEVPLYNITQLSLIDPAKIEDGELEVEDKQPLAKRKVVPARELTPSDQTPWGIEKIYNDSNIVQTLGGKDINVAVLDTGVFKNHLDLKNRLKQCKDFTRGPTPRNSCDDRNGHGTHVAGTILADAGSDKKGIYGVAPEANLFAYKVCDNAGFCWADDIANAIRHGADQGAEIISMSLGGDSPSKLIDDAIEYALTKGLLIVAAAGNDGPEIGSIDWPAANQKVIAVAAIDKDELTPSWSSKGINPGLQAFVIEEREVEFGSPGASIESTWLDGGYRVLSGTSMATPHISGLAAKLWQGAGPSTRTKLQTIAKDLIPLGDDPSSGFGLPQVPTVADTF